MRAKLFNLNYVLLMLASILVYACGEDVEVTERKKQKENEQQIQAHLTQNGIPAKRTESGLYYHIYAPQPDSLPFPRNGDQLEIAYTASVLNGPVYASASETQPFRFASGDTSIMQGLREGITLMRKGEKAQFFINSYLAYRGQALDGVPPYSPLLFDVHLLDIRTEEQVLEEYIAKDSLLSLKETIKLKATADSIPWLYYVKTDTSSLTKPSPVSGQRVIISYTALLPDGQQFDSSPNFSFTIDAPSPANNPIPLGLHEGVKLMQLEGSAVLLMTSNLGFGKGSRIKKVPPFTPLIYRVTLIKIQ